MSNRNLHVKLTLVEDGTKVYIFKNHIVAIKSNANGSEVTVAEGILINVKEDAEKVIDMIYTW